jgi:hypothetical protein
MPTSVPPSTIIARPIANGESPAQRPNAYPQRNNIAMATAFERRSADLASPMNMNGIAIGKVEMKQSVQMLNAPSQSFFVSRGRAGSGICRNLNRISSNCSGCKADAITGGNDLAMMRLAVSLSVASRTARHFRMLRPCSLRRVIKNRPASIIPHARLQPSAPISIVRICILSAVATPQCTGERERHDHAKQNLRDPFHRVESPNVRSRFGRRLCH